MKYILLLIIGFFITNLLCEDNDMRYCYIENDYGYAIGDTDGKDSSYADISDKIHFTDNTTRKITVKINSPWNNIASTWNTSNLRIPVFDQRWENLPTNREIHFNSHFNGLHDIPTFFSVRINNSETLGLQKKQIIYNQDLHNMLGSSNQLTKWNHLRFENQKFYNYSASTTEKEVGNVNLYENNPSYLWKVHEYNYFYSETKSDNYLSIYVDGNETFPNSDGCIQIYLAGCGECNATLKLERGGETISSTNFTGSNTWQTVNINLKKTNNSEYFKLSIKTDTLNESQSYDKLFWGIADVGYLSTSKSCKSNIRYVSLNYNDTKNKNLTCENSFNTQVAFLNETAFLNKTTFLIRTASTISVIVTNTTENPTTTPLTENKTHKSSFDLLYLLIIIPIILIIVITGLIYKYIQKNKVQKNKKIKVEEKELLIMNPIPKAEINTYNWPPIKKIDFVDYVRSSFGVNKTNDDIDKQFKCFPTGYLKSAEVGKQQQNRDKNRYQEIVPYDENRVRLNQNLGDEDEEDYINASYVTGTNSPHEYILTQNPLESTVTDFFKMIWQEYVEYIVMISNCSEKFYRYWPDKNKTKRYGDIEIDMDDSIVHEFYVHRKFTLRRYGQMRKVNHLHFHAWSTEMLSSHMFIDFIDQLLQIPHQTAPVVFHCLAGIGRSATILLCDIALRKSATATSIPIFDIVNQMRECRAGSVANLRQYELAHLIILEALTYKSRAIDINTEFEVQFSRLFEGNVTKKMWSQYLENSDWLYTALTPYIVCKKYPKKNRYLDDNLLPVEHSRVKLKNKKIDYVHAMFVLNYQQKLHYIVAQQPLPATIQFFWLMILQNHVQIVINLHELDKHEDQFFPTIDNKNFELGANTRIVFINLEENLNFDKVNLKIETTDKIITSVTLINVKNWRKIKAMPESSDIMIDIWKCVYDGKVHNFPVLVCCDDGIVASGLAVCFFYMIEKMLEEQKCDIVGAIRAVRRTHTNFINFDQFVFLHSCALVFYKNCYSKYNRQK